MAKEIDERAAARAADERDMKMLRIIIFVIAAIVGAVILFVLLKVLFLYSTYSFFFGKTMSAFGVDSVFAQVLAVFLTVGSIMIMPWIISFFLFGRRKKELMLVTAVGCAVLFIGTYYATKDVYFDRSDGRPAKCYAKTLDGFKFSSVCDYDPKFGVKYAPVTQAVVKEIYFWEKTGKMEDVPSVQAGKYFDSLTGDPIVWYIERSKKSVSLFALPGHDPLTGEALKPITIEIVEKITCDDSGNSLRKKTTSVENYECLTEDERLAKELGLLVRSCKTSAQTEENNLAGTTVNGVTYYCRE